MSFLQKSYQEIVVSQKPKLKTLEIINVHACHPLLPGQVKFHPLSKFSSFVLVTYFVGIVAFSIYKSLKFCEIPNRIKQPIRRRYTLVGSVVKFAIKNYDFTASTFCEEVPRAWLMNITAEVCSTGGACKIVHDF
jgi:hypothetical protein